MCIHPNANRIMASCAWTSTSIPIASSPYLPRMEKPKSSALYAAAKEIGAHCAAVNDAFLRCKADDPEPSACLEQNAAVQNCAYNVLKSAMETCGEAFSQYAQCLDKQISQEYMFERCRPAESKLIECRSHIHQSSHEDAAAVVAAAAQESNRSKRK